MVLAAGSACGRRRDTRRTPSHLELELEGQGMVEVEVEVEAQSEVGHLAYHRRLRVLLEQ